jgi:hypothetical protein
MLFIVIKIALTEAAVKRGSRGSLGNAAVAVDWTKSQTSLCEYRWTSMDLTALLPQSRVRWGIHHDFVVQKNEEVGYMPS